MTKTALIASLAEELGVSKKLAKKIKIPAMKVVTFKAGSEFKAAVK